MFNALINTKYEPDRGKTPCWSFCQLAYRMLGRNITDSIWDMTRIKDRDTYSIALFKYTNDIWHTAIVWPDCSHILHAVERPSGIYILKDRLVLAHMRFIKGYYVG